MKHWKWSVMILSALFFCVLSFGCGSATPRKDLSVTEMERFFLDNQADFITIQKLIVPIFEDQSVSPNFRRVVISRSDTETKNADGTTEEVLTISTDFSIAEADRTALLQAAETLFEQTPILNIFSNDSEIYFFYYQEWGYEHYIGYREDRIPTGSFGNVEDSRQIDTNWYAVIAHD